MTENTYALSDCVNYENNRLGDCSGRVWKDQYGVVNCEACANRFPVTTVDYESTEMNRVYMDGMADEETGNVESPFGHMYRVGDSIVITNDRGWHWTHTYASAEHARLAFGIGVARHEAWENASERI